MAKTKQYQMSFAYLRPYAIGNALGIVSLLCLLFYAVMSWFSNYDASVIIQQYPIGFSFENWSILIGLVQTYVFGYVFGWIFTRIYNRSLRK